MPINQLRTKERFLYFNFFKTLLLADPGKARACSSNTAVINSLNRLTESSAVSTALQSPSGKR